MRKANQKVRLLLLYELLSRFSDEQRPLHAKTIMKMMADQGFPESKASLSADVLALNMHGYEVMFFDKDDKTFYYVQEPKFDSGEIRAVLELLSATKMDYKKKMNIFGNLAGLARGRRAGFLAKNIVSSETDRFDGNHLIYNLDTTETAVYMKRKVSFTYYSLNYRGEKIFDKSGERYVLNPLTAVYDKGNYYLAAYEDGREELAFFRMDRMESMLLETVPAASRPPVYENPESPECRERILSGLLGELTEVRLRLNEKTVEKFFDRFGESAEIKKTGEEYRAVVQTRLNSEFFAWLASAEGGIKIEKPREASEKFSDFIWEVKTDY